MRTSPPCSAAYWAEHAVTIAPGSCAARPSGDRQVGYRADRRRATRAERDDAERDQEDTPEADERQARRQAR
jgi:hypothetical protein